MFIVFFSLKCFDPNGHCAACCVPLNRAPPLLSASLIQVVFSPLPNIPTCLSMCVVGPEGGNHQPKSSASHDFPQKGTILTVCGEYIKEENDMTPGCRHGFPPSGGYVRPREAIGEQGTAKGAMLGDRGEGRGRCVERGAIPLGSWCHLANPPRLMSPPHGGINDRHGLQGAAAVCEHDRVM